LSPSRSTRIAYSNGAGKGSLGFFTVTEVADAIVRDVGIYFHRASQIVGELVAKVLAGGGKEAVISAEQLD